MSVLNTWFNHKLCRRITWHSPDGKTKKVYDFILSCNWIRKFTKNCRVYNSYDFDTDHRLVIASLNTPVTKIARFIGRKKTVIKQRINFSAIDDVAESNFINTVTENFSNYKFDESTNIELTEKLVTVIKNSAEATLPTKNRVRQTQPWHNDVKLEQLFRKKDELMSHNADRKSLASIRKKIRSRAKYLKNEHFKQEAEKINVLAINREIEKLFARAKNQQTTLKPINSACPPDKILDHFKKHFNPDDPSKRQTPDELTEGNLPDFVEELRALSDNTPIIDTPPSAEEIQKHLKELKANKASNDIEPELLKKLNSHPIMIQVVQRIMTNLWENLDLPVSWGNSRLTTIWKGKGSKSDPTKYRGISIGSTVCKLTINIILSRLRNWYESQLSDHQNGFRKNRGTTDGIYTIKRIQQISHRKMQPIFLMFVDLSAAFDHIPRRWLFDSIRLRFRPNQLPKMINILNILYEKTSLTYEENTFTTSSGVRQGGPESPPLFNLYIDFVMRLFIEKGKKEKIDFFEHSYRINMKSFTRDERVALREQGKKIAGKSLLEWCGYADDLVLFVKSREGLQKAAETLDNLFSKFGLAINISKTETMIINCNTEYPQSIVTLRGMILKNVVEFRYLGSVIKYDEANTGDSEINQRIQLSQSKFAEMSNLLQNFSINLRTRVMFLNSFVRSRLCYSCQNWNLTQYQYDRLDVAYRVFLRRMVRGGFRFCDESNGDFRYVINNNRLHQICGTSDLSLFIKLQQRNYVMHVIRMSLERNVKCLTFNDDKNVRRGRPAKSLLHQVTDNENVSIDQLCNISLGKNLGRST